MIDTGFESANSITGSGFADFVRSDLLLEDTMAGGRVGLLDGNAEIAPGVTCHLVRDTHTSGTHNGVRLAEITVSDTHQSLLAG